MKRNTVKIIGNIKHPVENASTKRPPPLEYAKWEVAIHEYHFWDAGFMARLAQLRKFTVLYHCSSQHLAEFVD